MSLLVEEHRNIPVMDEMTVMCPSELILGKEQELLVRVLPKLDQCSIVLDLSQVRQLDAAGLGTLATLRQIAAKHGRALQLVNPSPRATEILTLVGLDEVFLPVAA